jgi:hypothetical protein
MAQGWPHDRCGRCLRQFEAAAAIPARVAPRTNTLSM